MTPEQAVKNWYSDPANWKPHDPGASDFDDSLINVNIMISKCAVLNLGCFYPNTELKYHSLADYWYAIDFCPEVIERCQKDFPEFNHKIYFRCGDMRSLPYTNGWFDTVLDLSSGDHMPLSDYEDVVSEANRVLTEGGHFVVTYANLDHFPDGQEEVFGLWGYERRTKSTIMEQLLRDSGFYILKNSNYSTRSGFVCAKRLT